MKFSHLLISANKIFSLLNCFHWDVLSTETENDTRTLPWGLLNLLVKQGLPQIIPKNPTRVGDYLCRHSSKCTCIHIPRKRTQNFQILKEAMVTKQTKNNLLVNVNSVYVLVQSSGLLLINTMFSLRTKFFRGLMAFTFYFWRMLNPHIGTPASVLQRPHRTWIIPEAPQEEGQDKYLLILAEFSLLRVNYHTPEARLNWTWVTARELSTWKHTSGEIRKWHCASRRHLTALKTLRRDDHYLKTCLGNILKSYLQNQTKPNSVT